MSNNEAIIVEQALRLNLGTSMEEDIPISWDWTDPLGATMAIMGDKENGLINNTINKITKTISKADAEAVFHIKIGGAAEGEPISLLNLLDFEKVPVREGEDFNKDLFKKQRVTFVQSFINLLAMKYGIERKNFLPNMKYQPLKEGPLVGYINLAEQLIDEKFKDQLISEFTQLEQICWIRTENDGIVFPLDSTKTSIEIALDLAKAIWSFWALLEVNENPRQILLVIEIPDYLYENETIKNNILNILFMIREQVYKSPIGLLLINERIYPIPELNIRFQWFRKAQYVDFDLNDPINKNFIGEIVFSNWEMNEQSNYGVLYDLARNHCYPIKGII